MNRWQTFIAHSEPAELVQPGDSALDYPSGYTEMAPMFRTALANLRPDATSLQGASMSFAIVSPVCLHTLGFVQWLAALTTNRLDASEQRHELRDIISIGLGQNDVERYALRFDEDMVFAAFLAAIGWVRSSFFPPCTARTDPLSAIAREKSILSAPRNLSSNTRCKRIHTPALCHSRNRRQQVMPEPHPISLGSISQGMPDCSTNRMPVNMRRSSRRLRPGCILRRRRTGNNGWTISHSSSSTSSYAISPRNENRW